MQSIIATGERLDIDDVPAVKPPTNGSGGSSYSPKFVADMDGTNVRTTGSFTNTWFSLGIEEEWGGNTYVLVKKGNEQAYVMKQDLDDKRDPNGYQYVKDRAPLYIKKYASGGYIDYTGPAWVDGTKNKPEYMLNARQTLQFENLISALDILTNNNSLSSIKDNSVPKSVQYNLSINVDQISSDYDVDQMVERVEKKILDASKYRNINILKKSN